MTRNVQEIAADLDALTPHEFDYANIDAKGWERLDKLCDELRALNDPEKSAPLLFHTLERLDGVELGTPGPLVHTLEGWHGSYEALLAKSVNRKPVLLSVWMVNRILNTKPPNAELWLDLLRSVTTNPTASEETKLAAEDFVKYQTMT